MLQGYRTYIAAVAIIIHNLLNLLGLKEITGEQVSIAIDVILAVFVFIFRKLAKPKV